MELKTGYKKTNLGVIPKEWHLIVFSDIADVKIPWSIAGGPFGSNLKKSDYKQEGVRIIQLQNIGDGKFKDDYSIYTSEEKANELLSCNIFPGEIILSKMGDPVARACIVPKSDKRYLMASDGIRLAVDKDRFDERFVHDFINFTIFRKKAIEASTGTTRQRIGLDDLKNLPFIEPPFPEQQAIATVLSDIDALIESLDQLITKNRNIKQAAMQELLTGKRRFLEYNDEWITKRLDELAEIYSGGTPSTTQPQFWDGEILWCTPTDITSLKGHKYLSDTNRKITSEGLKNSSAQIIPSNSIVMTSRATIGECAINLIPVSTNQGFKNFVPFENIDVEFLYYLLLTKKHAFISLCAGSTFLEIGKTQIATFEVRIPATKAEQQAIATVLSDMDAEITALEKKRDKTILLKQGMMQELLTGRIRLI